MNFYENLTLFNSYIGGLGALIRIDNVSHVIDQGFDGIFVQSGQVSNIALSREFRTSLAKPYSACDLPDGKATSFNSALYARIVASVFDYTQSFCLRQCMQQLFVQQCACRAPFFASVFSEARICVTFEDISCLYNAYYTIYIVDNYPSETCLPQCPLECNSFRFTYALSSFNLLGDSYVNDIRANPNLSADFSARKIDTTEASRSVAKINVFYDSLSYTASYESPQWDLVGLIASVGGNLGLFLGVSLFSLGEVLTTLIEIFFYCQKRNKENDKVTKTFIQK